MAMSFDQVDRFRPDVGSEIIVADREAVVCVPHSDGESLRRTCIALRAMSLHTTRVPITLIRAVAIDFLVHPEV